MPHLVLVGHKGIDDFGTISGNLGVISGQASPLAILTQSQPFCSYRCPIK